MGKAQPKNPRRTWALCPPQKPFCVARRLGRGKKESARGTTGSSPARLLLLVSFAQQVGWKKRTARCFCVTNVTGLLLCLFRRDIHWTLMLSGLYQKDLSKEKRSLAKAYFKQTYCHVCHTRFAVFSPLPSCSVSSQIFFPLPSCCVSSQKNNNNNCLFVYLLVLFRSPSVREIRWHFRKSAV